MSRGLGDVYKRQITRMISSMEVGSSGSAVVAAGPPDGGGGSPMILPGSRDNTE